MGERWCAAGRRVARAAVAALTVAATTLLPGLGGEGEQVAARPAPRLDGGYAHTCALQSGGQIVCWGLSAFTQLTPPPGLAASRLSAGENVTCALRAGDGQVVCWGDNTFGQATPPVDLMATQVSAGHVSNCALRAGDGRVVCWGDNRAGQATPPDGLTASQVSAGGSHACAVRAGGGRVVCWGANDFGQATPPKGLVASQVSAGTSHTCAVREPDSLAVCWGDNRDGQAAPPPGLTAGYVSAGYSHTCASRAADEVTLCWGWNAHGQAPQPFLHTQAPQVAAVGQWYGLALGDLVGSPLPYSATYAVTAGSIPPGLTLDPGVGVITGYPTLPGQHSVTVTATDGVNFQASQTYSFTIFGGA
jgi:alpha-tubulin suppressor-like RCC1 family protein